MDDPKLCSFCLKSLREIRNLVASETGVAICNECISLSVAIMLGVKSSMIPFVRGGEGIWPLREAAKKDG